MEQWEYKVVLISNSMESEQRRLDKFGAEGWELAGVGGGFVYFKRRKN